MLDSWSTIDVRSLPRVTVTSYWKRSAPLRDGVLVSDSIWLSSTSLRSRSASSASSSSVSIAAARVNPANPPLRTTSTRTLPCSCIHPPSDEEPAVVDALSLPTCSSGIRRRLGPAAPPTPSGGLTRRCFPFARRVGPLLFPAPGGPCRRPLGGHPWARRRGNDRPRATDPSSCQGAQPPPWAAPLARQVDADRTPRVANSHRLFASSAIELLGRARGQSREAEEADSGPDSRAQQCRIPDLPGTLPAVPLQRGRDQVEGMVGDAGVDVDPAIVRGRDDIVTHVRWLRVLAEHRVVIGRAGCGHRPQRHALDPVGEEPFADQPVGVLGLLRADELLDHRAEDVRYGLVEGPGLRPVDQSRFVLGDAVCELMADDIHRYREAVEELAIAVPEHHLGAVPEGVVVVLVVVD